MGQRHLGDPTIGQAAGLLGVCPAYVRHAIKILGNPQLCAQVSKGEMALTTAADEAQHWPLLTAQPAGPIGNTSLHSAIATAAPLMVASAAAALGESSEL